ncbi:MAG: hypothetical protein ACLPKI_04350 [Streptosporangiaceae bacterium]
MAVRDHLHVKPYLTYDEQPSWTWLPLIACFVSCVSWIVGVIAHALDARRKT